MKKITIILISFLISLSSCSEIMQNNTYPLTEGDLVLIIKDIPENYKFFYKGDSGPYRMSSKAELSFNLDKLNSSYYIPDYSKKIDTIVIKSLRSNIEIQHKYKGIDNISFIARPCDTLYFNYKDKMPIVRNSKRSKKYDYSYEELIRKKVYLGDFPAYLKYYNLLCFADEAVEFNSIPKKERFGVILDSEKLYDSKYHSQKYKKAIIQFNKEEQILDSLISNDLISKDISSFYKDRIKYKRLTIKSSKESHYSFNDFKQTDSLLKYSFYRDIISDIAYHEIVSKAKITKVSNGYIRNKEEIYDKIRANPYLSYGTKKFLSYRYIESILESSSNEQIKKYFKLFKNAYAKDTILISNLVKEYNLNVEISDDIDLINKSGVKTSFKEILEKNKGKLIYVDLWASWCSPCRSLMPSSHKLRDEYKGKNIIFVYLAYNDKLNSWKGILNSVNLAEYKNNYLITNSRKSRYLMSLNVETIPRFLLFDKKGKLIHKNAPKPDSKEIQTIFNKYINQ